MVSRVGGKGKRVEIKGNKISVTQDQYNVKPTVDLVPRDKIPYLVLKFANSSVLTSNKVARRVGENF
jgi:hypothetical protein